MPDGIVGAEAAVTFYMNKRLGRTGTLGEGRYKSVLVEDTERALLTVSAYIDLN